MANLIREKDLNSSDNESPDETDDETSTTVNDPAAATADDQDIETLDETKIDDLDKRYTLVARKYLLSNDVLFTNNVEYVHYISDKIDIGDDIGIFLIYQAFMLKVYRRAIYQPMIYKQPLKM